MNLEEKKLEEKATLDQGPPAAVSSVIQTLRVWPAVLLLLVLWAFKLTPGAVLEWSPSVFMLSMLGPAVCCLLIVIWWTFFSRASWKERLWVLLGLAIVIGATTALSDKTLRGFGTLIYALPTAHQGYLYGFDHNIFACVDLKTGDRMWKKGRYGNGQVLLLPDADQLLVLSEEGELILLRATPERLEELARRKALEGKTWNHPVLVGDRLYVRNGEQAACYQMPLQSEEK